MAKYKLGKDQAGDFYWILISDKNHKTVAMSSEAYNSKQGAVDSTKWTRANAKDARFEDSAGQ